MKYWGYVVALFLVYVMIGFIVTALYEMYFRDRKFIFFGYQLHHSVYGVLLFLLSMIFFYQDKGLWFIPASIGIGVISRHTHLEKRVKFIEKHESNYRVKMVREKWDFL